MAQHRNLDPDTVQREYLRHGANVRQTAAALNTSRETVYQALKRATPLIVPKVTVIVEGGTDDDREAIAAYVRASLDSAGIHRDPSVSPEPEHPEHRDTQDTPGGVDR